MTTQQNWFQHGEAAEYCRISPRTLRRWRAADRIRAYGGRYFRDDLDRAVRNEPQPVLSEMVETAKRVTPVVLAGVEALKAGILVSDTPIRWRAISPEETAQMDAHADGAAERNGDQLPEQTFRSAVPDCPFLLGTGKCATGCQGPDGPACWEPAEPEDDHCPYPCGGENDPGHRQAH